MCLSVVARIEELLENGEAIAELGNVRKRINLGLMEGDIIVGDWILVHTGFAIAKINEQKAKEILAAYGDMDHNLQLIDTN